MSAPRDRDPRQGDLFAPRTPDLETLRRKLANTSQEARNLTVMAMNPKHPPERAELLHNLERSARAQCRLLARAIEYAEDPAAANRRFAARRASVRGASGGNNG
jgi:hypothetical protein